MHAAVKWLRHGPGLLVLISVLLLAVSAVILALPIEKASLFAQTFLALSLAALAITAYRRRDI